MNRVRLVWEMMRRTMAFGTLRSDQSDNISGLFVARLIGIDIRDFRFPIVYLRVSSRFDDGILKIILFQLHQRMVCDVKG